MKNDTVKNIFWAKSRCRRELTILTFEEKIKILIQLRRIAKGIRKDLKLKVWNIE